MTDETNKRAEAYQLVSEALVRCVEVMQRHDDLGASEDCLLKFAHTIKKANQALSASRRMLSSEQGGTGKLFS